MSAGSVINQIVAASVTVMSEPSIQVPNDQGGTTTVYQPVGLSVVRYSTVTIKATYPTMIVYPRHDKQLERIGPESAPMSDREFTLCVECRAVGETVDEQLDPLIVWAVQALNIDPTFGALATGLQQVQTVWEPGKNLDQVYGAAGVFFLVRYVTYAADPTQTVH